MADEKWKDPVIEAYKRDVDRTLLRKNIRSAPSERVLAAMELQKLAIEVRRAGRPSNPCSSLLTRRSQSEATIRRCSSGTQAAGEPEFSTMYDHDRRRVAADRCGRSQRGRPGERSRVAPTR